MDPYYFPFLYFLYNMSNSLTKEISANLTVSKIFPSRNVVMQVLYTSLACMFCSPNVGHEFILQKTVSFKFYLIYFHINAYFMKKHGGHFP